MMKYRIIILLFFLNLNLDSFGQTWDKLQNDLDHYFVAQDYSSAFKITDKMEVYARKHLNDSSFYLANTYFYKLILSVYLSKSDTVVSYYSYKLTNQISGLAYSKYYPSIKPTLLNFSIFLQAAKIDKTWMFPMYCYNIRALASIYSKDGQQDSAISKYKEIIKIYKGNNLKDEDYCGTLVSYSQLLYNQNKYDEAEEKLKEVLFIYDSLGVVSGYFNLAILQYSTIKVVKSEVSDAINVFNRHISKIETDTKITSRNYHDFFDELAYLHELSGNYSVAEQSYLKALNVKGLNELDYLWTLENLARFYRTIDNYQKSDSLYVELVKLEKNLYGTKNLQYASAINNYGVLQNKIGNYEMAEALTIEALNIRKSLLGENDPIYAASLFDLGAIYYNIGNFSKTERLFIEALEIRQTTFGQNSKFTVESFAELALLYHKQRDYNRAEFYYNKSIEFYEKTGNDKTPLFATYLSNLAALYNDLKEYNKAEKLYVRAGDIFKSTSGSESIGYANTIANMANLYFDLGLIDKSNDHFKQANSIFKKITGENSEPYLTNMSNHTLLYEFLGDYNTASLLQNNILTNKINKLNRNFKWLSENEKAQYWESQKYYFENLNYFVVKSYKSIPSNTELAYNGNLISKSLLLESSNSIYKFIKNSKEKDLLEIYGNFKSISRFHHKILSEGGVKLELVSRLEHQLDSLDQLLARKMSIYADFKKNFSLSWKDIQNNLDNAEASVEFTKYYDSKDSTYYYLALIVKGGDKYPALIKLCSENELEKFTPEKELNDLYDLVWKPLIPQLVGIKTIYYSPVGLLNNIPFHALFNIKDEKRNYIIDNYTLHQLTSTRYLALGLKQKINEITEPSIALFGGVNYNEIPTTKSDSVNKLAMETAFLYKSINREINDSSRSGVSYLPGTKKEVDNIAVLLKLKQWNVSLVEDKNASEGKLKSFAGSNSKSILHIATHGFAFPDKEEPKKGTLFNLTKGNTKYTTSDNPMIRCGLLFGGANITWKGKSDSVLNATNDDGILTAYELSQLDLSNTKLAVLSACETGKGAIQGSEGTFGLKRALKLAGVENMIVSLWKVPDDATMQMMTIFYTELAKTKNPVTSFEFAQKKMRNVYPDDPKKWAGFVFVR